MSYALIIANNASLDPKQAALRYADDDGALRFPARSWVAVAAA